MNLKYLLLTLFCLVFTSQPANAHWADMSAMEINITNNQAEADLTIPTKFLEKADTNNDGLISDQEINKSSALIVETLNKDVYIKSDGELGKLTVLPSQTSKSDITGTKSQSTLQLRWTWENPGKTYKLHYSLFPPEAVNASCLVSSNVDGKSSTLTFNQKNTESYLKEMTVIESIKEFIFLGVEHIATGYDHILF